MEHGGEYEFSEGNGTRGKERLGSVPDIFVLFYDNLAGIVTLM